MKKLLILPVLGLFFLAGCGIASDKNTSGAVDTSTPAPILEMAIADGEYEVNTETSVVSWLGSKITGVKHPGTIDIKSGSFVMLGDKFGGGKIVMDMMTIESDEDLDDLETHLEGDEFFNIEEYPEATLVLQAVMPTSEEDMYQVGGDLTIKDMTQRIEFLAKITGDTTLKITADFEIDRIGWGLLWGSGKGIDNLKDKYLNDEIQFNLDIEAKI